MNPLRALSDASERNHIPTVDWLLLSQGYFFIPTQVSSGLSNVQHAKHFHEANASTDHPNQLNTHK
jgi:hypothetical protein